MTIEGALKRVIYTSRVRGALSDADRTAIYAASKRNNGMDGITGILWVENRRFLQLIEGPQESVDLALSRIRADNRHDGITVLDESMQRDRVFPDWAMAGLPGERSDEALERLSRLLRHAPDDVTQHFPTLAMPPVGS